MPSGKRVEIGLTDIHGIGRSRSNEILAGTGVEPDTRVKDLNEKPGIGPIVEGGCCGKRQEVAQEEDFKAQTQKETQAPAVAAPQEAVESQNCGSKARCRSWTAAMRRASRFTQAYCGRPLVLGGCVWEQKTRKAR